MGKNFVPLLFAGDINVYSVARAFHEAYGIKSFVYGKYNSGPCLDSRIIEYRAVAQADEAETFFKLVVEFAEDHREETVILVGCGDSYVELAAMFKDRMPENVVAPYINLELMEDLTHKEKFYRLCQENGVDYPKTYVHRASMGIEFDLEFNGPYILKPSNGIEYWKNPFEGQKKVFIIKDMLELQCTMKDVYEAGYDDSLIIQEFIPGDDTHMRVLTNYSDRNGQVKMMCMGHVLLEEHTPKGIGNHAVILTKQNRQVEESFRKLLESIGYVGFSNFDIKYDARDDKYKVFEINTRQGRSNFYVTGSGANIAEYLVKDYVEGRELEFSTIDRENLWMVVPKKVAFDYIKQGDYRREMKRLIKEGKYVNPLQYREDRNLKRFARVTKMLVGHHFKFKKYLGK